MGMTATERLRALLDERGVEYETYIEPQTGFEHVKWNFNEHGSADFNIEFGEPWLTMYGAISGPEQAIAATLGPKVTGNASDGYHTFNELDQAPEWDGHTPSEAIERIATLGSCNCSNNCTSSERTETCRLDGFADVPFSVDYEIEGYDMGSSRDYATLAECSSCGAYVIVPPEYHHVLTCDGDEVYQPYRFCPNCGARIEVDDG